MWPQRLGQKKRGDGKILVTGGLARWNFQLAYRRSEQSVDMGTVRSSHRTGRNNVVRGIAAVKFIYSSDYNNLTIVLQ